jgi:tetratricopeptide (TPR) repeat protein
VETLTAMRYIPALPSAWAGLGEVHLVAGRFPEALTAALRAAELCEQHGQQATHATVLRLIGDIHAATTPPGATDAEDAYRRALALAERLGLRPLAARCHLGLGKLWAQTGRRVEAVDHLSTASRMFGSMALNALSKEAGSVHAALASVGQ